MLPASAADTFAKNNHMKHFTFTLMAALIVCGSFAQTAHKSNPLKAGTENATRLEPLKNAMLEGSWEMQTGEWGASKLGEGKYKDVTVIKMYAYPHFSFAYYNSKTNTFVGAGGGTYQFDGTTLTEKIEYWSWGTPKFPLSVFKVQINATEYTQEGWQNGLRETWRRIK
jgi:hypothetical protein